MTRLTKFLKRLLKRRYKGRDFKYKQYVLEIPARFNRWIEENADGVFDEIDITISETSTEKVVNIVLTNKNQKTNSLPAT